MPHTDGPVRYIERTHAWYGALGCAPYRYASFPDVPFSALCQPLSSMRVALLTTAAPYRPRLGEQGAVRGAPASSPWCSARPRTSSNAGRADCAGPAATAGAATTRTRRGWMRWPLAQARQAHQRALARARALRQP